MGPLVFEGLLGDGERWVPREVLVTSGRDARPVSTVSKEGKEHQDDPQAFEA